MYKLFSRLKYVDMEACLSPGFYFWVFKRKDKVTFEFPLGNCDVVCNYSFSSNVFRPLKCNIGSHP